VLHRTSHRNGATQRGRSAAASSRTMKHGAAATGRRPLVPTAWLEQAMPPLGDGSFTGCWTSTRHFVGILLGGRSRSACPADERRRRLLAPGRPRKRKARLLRCGGALIASPRAADRAEALPLAGQGCGRG